MSLATIQSQLASVFLNPIIAQTRVAYVGGLFNGLLTYYSSTYTSSYLASLDPNLTINIANGVYIAKSLSASVGPST
jgi:hypothetical protein